MKKHLKNLTNLLLGWIFGTLGMFFMPILALFGWEYDVKIERK